MSERDAVDVFRAVAVAVPVSPAPLDAVTGLARKRRRRRVQWVAGGVALVVGVAGFAARTTSREPGPLTRPVVVRAENPAAVPWYADQTLHLAEVAVELPGLQDMVQVPDGVVYVDRDGRVVLVDQQGRLTQLGLTGSGSPLTGSLARGWVAWVQEGDDGSELVVHDTSGQRLVGRLPVAAGARPVALDRDRVYYRVGAASFSWHPPDGEAEPQPGPALIDVASAVRAWRAGDDLVRVTQPLFNLEVQVPGVTASLTDDGDLVMTRDDSRLPDEVRIFVAADGEELDSGLGRDDVAVAAAWGPDHTVTYLVAHRESAPAGGDFVRLSESGPLLLRSCDLDSGVCQSLSQISRSSGVPALPD